MNKEIIKEQIIRSLEDILDQTHAIFENDGKIPLIEIDIIKSNVRKLYEQYVNLNNHNIILSDPISTTHKINTTTKLVTEKAVIEKELNEKSTTEVAKEDPSIVAPSAIISIEKINLPTEEKADEKRSFIKFERIEENEENNPISEKITLGNNDFTEIEEISIPKVEDIEFTDEIEAISSVENIELPTFEPELVLERDLVENTADPIMDSFETVETPIAEEPENTSSTKEKTETLALFPDLFEEVKEDKPEAVKRKRPKSPLDLFSDNTPSIADKFKEEKATVNDKISEQKADNSIATKMQHQPISDIKKAIGINEKFLFINELFDGNMADYNEAIDHINANCNNREEAESYIVFLKQNYSWDDARMSVSLFHNLIERRFPNI